MEQPYNIKIIIKNPNEDDISVRLIADEELQHIPGKCEICTGDNATYIGQAHQDYPETIPGTKKVPGGGTKEFIFKYGHDWHWLYSLESPNAPIMKLFQVIPYSQATFNILTGSGVPGLAILGFVPMLSTAADAVPQLHYKYTISSIPEVDWGFYPNNYDITVDTKYEKKAGTFLAWSQGGAAGGFTALGAIVAPMGPAGLAVGVGLWATEAYTFMQASDNMNHAIDPNLNYKQVVLKNKIIIPEMDEIPEGPSKEAVWDTIRVLEDVAAYTDTMIKYDGATVANDTEWMLIHESRGALYARDTASDTARQRESMKSMINEIKALNISITDEKIENIKLEIARDGLPEFEVRILKRFGYSDDEIKQLANTTVSTIDPDFIKQYDTSLLLTNEIVEKTYANLSVMLAGNVAENTARANIKIEPSIIHSASNDPWVTAYIGVPGQNVSQINISTVKMNGIPAINDTSYSFVTNPEIVDVNSDGYPELKVVFNKPEVQQFFTRGENDVTSTGLLSDIYFVGNATITYIVPTPPIAYFHANVTYGNKPLTVEFTDASLDLPTSWLWTFGDGTNATEQNPVHVYTNAGNYLVVLIVTNADGSDTRTKYDYITILADPITLIDQLIQYINSQNINRVAKKIYIDQLNGVKKSLTTNKPGDAIIQLKVFKVTVQFAGEKVLTPEQASTIKDSVTAIIAAINVPVNQQAIDMTKALKVYVKDLGLPKLTQGVLVLELEGAQLNLEGGKDKEALDHFTIFMKTVKFQDGKAIPHDKAMQLIAKAQDIVNAIQK